jgi:type II secretory pathway pseudopilin PulG
MRKSEKACSTSILRVLRGNSGISLLEVTALLAFLSILIALGYYVYHHSVTKAKIVVAENTLKTLKENLDEYRRLYKKYPDGIDFNTCTDQDGDLVFYPTFCKQLKTNLYSIESYTRDRLTGFSLMARANDTENTLFETTAEGVNLVIVKQEKKNEF